MKKVMFTLFAMVLLSGLLLAQTEISPTLDTEPAIQTAERTSSDEEALLQAEQMIREALASETVIKETPAHNNPKTATESESLHDRTATESGEHDCTAKTEGEGQHKYHHGWSKGEKTGWNGADTPPGLQKKDSDSGSGNSKAASGSGGSSKKSSGSKGGGHSSK